MTGRVVRLDRFVALNNPLIVTIYDLDQADGIDLIAMEFVSGKTLDPAVLQLRDRRIRLFSLPSVRPDRALRAGAV